MNSYLRLYVAVLLGLALFCLPTRASALSDVAPPAAPRAVVVGTYVNHVYGIDIKNSQFTVDFYIWFRWDGDDLKPLDSFEVAGGRVTSKTGIEKKKLGAQNFTSARIVATVTKFWELKRYPMDGHTLTLEIEDAEHDTRTMLYEQDHDNIGISPELQVPGWVIKTTGAEVERHLYRTNYGDTSFPTNTESSYARYRFSIEVARPGYGRFLKVFFGLFISVLVSWCAFWVRPKESSPRVSLGIGATFAASAVTVTINNSLPDTNSVTMADKLIMLTLGIIVLSLAETIVALTLFAGNQETTQQRLDRVCRWAFPVAYLAALAVIVAY